MAGTVAGEGSVFQERLTSRIVGDAFRFAALPLVAAAGCWVLGWQAAALALLALAGFVVFFFRNPERTLPDDPSAVLAPADGRVIEVGEIEEGDGRKALRVGIFLSVFDVHVNRMPVAGRVLSVERSGTRFLAAFDRKAEHENARVGVTLETERGVRVRVVQIAGLVARRIVCHARVGEWVPRGARYGLIRFGSRTDVVLPPGSVLSVAKGQRVRGGSSVIGSLEGQAP